MRVLVVEDAKDMAQVICGHLQDRRIATDCAGTIADAEDHIAVQDYDCIVLDLFLPDGSGLQLLKSLRAKHCRAAILILTVASDLDSKLQGLNYGADDFMVKPFHVSELEARIRAITRRAHGDAQEEITFGDLTLDPVEKVAFIKDESIFFTKKEYSVLETLFKSRKKPVNKQRILERVYAFADSDVNLNAIETYIGRIRKKLAGSNVIVKTLKGIGYQLDIEE
jgi:two-component system response regulator TctD